MLPFSGDARTPPDQPHQRGAITRSPGYTLPDDEAVRLARYIMARYEAHHVIWLLGGGGNYLDPFEQPGSIWLTGISRLSAADSGLIQLRQSTKKQHRPQERAGWWLSPRKGKTLY
jgi:hypothetical protein